MTKHIHRIGRKRRCYRRPQSQAALMQPRATFCVSSGNLHLHFFRLWNFSSYLPSMNTINLTYCIKSPKFLKFKWSTPTKVLLRRHLSPRLEIHPTVCWQWGPRLDSQDHLVPREYIHLKRILFFNTLSSWCCVAWLLAGSTFGYSSENITGSVLLTMNMTIKRQSIMFLRPANPYDLDQRHNRPDKRGLLPFSHRLQPQPGINFNQTNNLNQVNTSTRQTTATR